MLVYLISGLAFLGVGYLLCEWLYRYVSIRNSKDHFYVNNLILYSSSVLSEPGKEIGFRFCGVGGEILARADIKLNNKGLFSTHDYHPENDGDCYKIIVLGQEQTASSVVDLSWPDFLEQELNTADKDCFAGKPVKVYNLAWPDNGLAHMEAMLSTKVAEYSPDLVLVNMNDSDVYRGMEGTPQTIKGKPLVHSLIEYRTGPGEEDVATIAMSASARVTSLADPRAVPPHPYGFYVAPSFLHDPSNITRLQEQVANDFLKGCRMGARLWFARRLLGRKFDISVIRNFDAMPTKPADKDELTRKACGYLLAIMDIHPNTLILTNVNWGELNSPAPYEFSNRIQKAEPRIEITDMREHLASFRQDEDGYDWYLNPYMMEKWSPKGHKLFAKAVANVTREKAKSLA